MSRTRVTPFDQRHSALLMLLAALLMAAAAIHGATAVYAQDEETATESPAAEEATTDAAASDEAAAAGGIDGTWSVDTEIGSFEGTDEFDPFSGSWVGFRVNEVLERIGEAQAVGRTPAVTGSLAALGATIDSIVVEADLTAIRSDQARRDPAIQRALQTTDFPTATFESSGAVELPSVPVEGETFTATVPGTITIHGVAQDVSLDITGQRVGDVVLVVGALPVDFTSYGVTMPTAPIVVSVEDTGDLEWQLFFRQQG